ncbi:MAG: hypothetical protein ACHQUC_02555 [Chlamydiales bacterium]
MVSKLITTMKDPVPLNFFRYRIEFIHEGVCFLEGEQPVRAAVGFISSGPDQTAVNEAMSMFKKINFPAAAFFLDSEMPFPAKALEAFAEKVCKIVVIESGATLLLTKMVIEKTWINPVAMVPPHGGLISAWDIFEKEDWN